MILKKNHASQNNNTIKSIYYLFLSSLKTNKLFKTLKIVINFLIKTFSKKLLYKQNHTKS